MNLLLEEKIFSISSNSEFEQTALEIFRFQAEKNETYKSYIKHRNIDTEKVKTIKDIPFLPIQFFRTHRVITGDCPCHVVFSSSGTTNTTPSQHFVSNIGLYEKSFLESFKLFYCKPSNYIILALLPAYLEREGSSLVYMVDKLIKLSNHDDSGFFLDNLDALVLRLRTANHFRQKAILIGVSFALIDLIEKYDLKLNNTIIMETGGMKGRRKEMTRQELHTKLKAGTGSFQIHSEYGMTELLSQAYSRGNGIFVAPPWMRILARDLYDPLAYVADGQSGGVNIIDLANIYSCSFIETEDIGKVHSDMSFEILGRADNTAIRGCNLMVL